MRSLSCRCALLDNSVENLLDVISEILSHSTLFIVHFLCVVCIVHCSFRQCRSLYQISTRINIHNDYVNINLHNIFKISVKSNTICNVYNFRLRRLHWWFNTLQSYRFKLKTSFRLVYAYTINTSTGMNIYAWHAHCVFFMFFFLNEISQSTA